MVDMRKMKLRSGTEIWVEVEAIQDGRESGLAPASRKESLEEGVSESFAKALCTIEEIICDMQDGLFRMAQRPDEVMLELGVKFSFTGGIIIAKGGLDNSLKVTLLWKTRPSVDS